MDTCALFAFFVFEVNLNIMVILLVGAIVISTIYNRHY